MSSIEVSSLSKSFQSVSGKRLILDNVSIQIQTEIPTIFYGPSGSGKTTLLQIIGGLISPDEGKITAFDKIVYPHQQNGSFEIKKQISWVPQNIQLFDELKISENIDIFGKGRNYSSQLIDILCDKFGISELLDYYPSRLSMGEKQRVAIVRSIVSNSKLLIFDEPTSAMDKINSQQFIEILKDNKIVTDKIILIATHDYIFFNNNFVIYKFENGKLLAQN